MVLQKIQIYARDLDMKLLCDKKMKATCLFHSQGCYEIPMVFPHQDAAVTKFCAVS
jgi:hypothetical protein